MPLDPKYAGYARETAMCVDLAYTAVEQDIRAELDRAIGEECAALKRVLQRMQDRRAVLEPFTAASLRRSAAG